MYQTRVYGGERKGERKEKFPLSHLLREAAGREFQNPYELEMPQTYEHAGIKNSTGIMLLRQARILRSRSAIGKKMTCCYLTPHEHITL